MNRYEKILRDHNISPSLQRIIILEYLFKNKTHPTVDDIYSNLQKTIPTLSKTTVYNTLKSFLEKKIIEIVHINKTETHYDLSIYRHDHFVCSECSEIYDFDRDEKLEHEEINGHIIKEKHVAYFGICKNCRQKDK